VVTNWLCTYIAYIKHSSFECVEVLELAVLPDKSLVLPELEENFDDEPVETPCTEFGEFQLVGHGSVTNEKCGKFKSFYGCARVELHERVQLNGKNYSGKVYVRKVFHSCDKPSCPICYKYGWASREAHRIEVRLAEASKRFGKAEHIVCSVPPSDYGLNYDALRKKVQNILHSLGIVGGVLIFHGFRYNKRHYWFWSPHFHVLGFILGGYGRCRCCSKRRLDGCAGCGGFDDRRWQCYKKTGYYMKVLGERETVGGTAWYQLHHSSLRHVGGIPVKRFQVAHWFGVCSYRKLKVTVEYKKSVCPICQHDLVRLDYSGVKRFVLDRDSPDFRRVSFEDSEENGRVVWFEHAEDG
jgi:uncharacterized protein with PIN domain